MLGFGKNRNVKLDVPKAILRAESNGYEKPASQESTSKATDIMMSVAIAAVGIGAVVGVVVVEVAKSRQYEDYLKRKEEYTEKLLKEHELARQEVLGVLSTAEWVTMAPNSEVDSIPGAISAYTVYRSNFSDGDSGGQGSNFMVDDGYSQQFIGGNQCVEFYFDPDEVGLGPVVRITQGGLNPSDLHASYGSNTLQVCSETFEPSRVVVNFKN